MRLEHKMTGGGKEEQKEIPIRLHCSILGFKDLRMHLFSLQKTEQFLLHGKESLQILAIDANRIGRKGCGFGYQSVVGDARTKEADDKLLVGR